MAAKKTTSLERMLERVETLDAPTLAGLAQRLARERGLFERVFNALQEGLLVIDDDAALREQLQAEAKDWGFSVEIAVNTAIARAMLTSDPPDVVLLDLSFPKSEGDGLLLLQEM